MKDGVVTHRDNKNFEKYMDYFNTGLEERACIHHWEGYLGKLTIFNFWTRRQCYKHKWQ